MSNPNLPPAESGKSPASVRTWNLGPYRWEFSRPIIMGVLNATPDSFSDGGRFQNPQQAVTQALALAQYGADMIDLGGASSHPHAAAVSIDEELRRITPVMERLVGEVPLPLSIDTQHAQVAESCLNLGAHLINDVSGGQDPRMTSVAAAHDAPLVITYNNFNVPPPASASALVPGMLAFFRQRIEQAVSQGATRLLLDPGYGFGKSLDINLAVLRNLPALGGLEHPILVCTSRKGSLGKISGEASPRERLGASIASSLYAVRQGAAVVRVHDVRQFHQALLTWRAIDSPASG